jgi:uncharacterized protein (DUF58 family)
VTLALASVSLQQHDPVGVFPFGENMQVLVKGKTGRTAVMQLAHHLAGLRPQSATRLPEALARFEALRMREGLLAIVSDFFDPRGLEPLFAALSRSRHRLLLVQLTRASDAAPEVQGEVRIRDCESGEVTDVTVSSGVLERYRQAYSRFNETLSAFARRRRIRLLRVDADKELIPQLMPVFDAGPAL